MTASTPLQILGVELALLGSFAALAFGGVEPHIVFRAYVIATVVSFVLGPGMRGPIWGSIGLAGTALLPSFLAVLPGALFFLQAIKPHHEVPYLCYDLPMSGWSMAWFVVGPLLFVASAFVSPWRASPRTLIVLHVAHAIAWLLATGNAMLCAMTV